MQLPECDKIARDHFLQAGQALGFWTACMSPLLPQLFQGRQEKRERETHKGTHVPVITFRHEPDLMDFRGLW